MNKEINLITLCVFLPNEGDEVLDRYNPFCLFPIVNTKQGGVTLCVAISVCFFDHFFWRVTGITPSSASVSQEEMTGH